MPRQSSKLFAIQRKVVSRLAMMLVLVCATFGSVSTVRAEAAPDFTLRDTTGQPVSIKGYRGAVLWLTFGATW